MRTLPPCHVAALDTAAITGLSNMKMGVCIDSARPIKADHAVFVMIYFEAIQGKNEHAGHSAAAMRRTSASAS